jgi:hypothetical protein
MRLEDRAAEKRGQGKGEAISDRWNLKREHLGKLNWSKPQGFCRY